VHVKEKDNIHPSATCKKHCSAAYLKTRNILSQSPVVFDSYIQVDAASPDIIRKLQKRGRRESLSQAMASNIAAATMYIDDEHHRSDAGNRVYVLCVE
jgi:hypothetical protein